MSGNMGRVRIEMDSSSDEEEEPVWPRKRGDDTEHSRPAKSRKVAGVFSFIRRFTRFVASVRETRGFVVNFSPNCVNLDTMELNDNATILKSGDSIKDGRCGYLKFEDVEWAENSDAFLEMVQNFNIQCTCNYYIGFPNFANYIDSITLYRHFTDAASKGTMKILEIAQDDIKVIKIPSKARNPSELEKKLWPVVTGALSGVMPQEMECRIEVLSAGKNVFFTAPFANCAYTITVIVSFTGKPVIDVGALAIGIDAEIVPLAANLEDLFWKYHRFFAADEVTRKHIHDVIKGQPALNGKKRTRAGFVVDLLKRAATAICDQFDTKPPTIKLHVSDEWEGYHDGNMVNSQTLMTDETVRRAYLTAKGWEGDDIETSVKERGFYGAWGDGKDIYSLKTLAAKMA